MKILFIFIFLFIAHKNIEANTLLVKNFLDCVYKGDFNSIENNYISPLITTKINELNKKINSLNSYIEFKADDHSKDIKFEEISNINYIYNIQKTKGKHNDVISITEVNTIKLNSQSYLYIMKIEFNSYEDIFFWYNFVILDPENQRILYYDKWDENIKKILQAYIFYINNNVKNWDISYSIKNEIMGNIYKIAFAD